jgi:soluble P-type ATPase
MYYNGNMIELDIPGRGILRINYIVFDVNGTLAVDGNLISGIDKMIFRLQKLVKIYLITANTHGKQKFIDNELGINATILKKGDEINQKKEFVENLSAASVISIGQGKNDSGMLKSAAIGICVLSPEGTAVETLLSADIVVSDITTALELIENPSRLVATLRK